MKNTPQKIYLQTGVADGTVDESISDFDQLFRSAITWSTHRIYESDIEYNLSDSNSDIDGITDCATTTKAKYDRDALQAAKDNHIWLNAMHCVRPTDGFLIAIGKSVLSKLNNKENIMPSDGITSDNKSIRELAKLTPTLYMSVNKS